MVCMKFSKILLVHMSCAPGVLIPVIETCDKNASSLTLYTRKYLTYCSLSPPQRLLLAMITISSIEMHFTALYMADLGTRVEPLGEGAQAGKE